MGNDFYLNMSSKVFKTLHARYQIPAHILMCLPRKFVKCSGKTADIGMYDTMFTVGLRLLVTELHYQLPNYLGLSVSQIAPNMWRIIIGAEAIWGKLSGGNHRLSLGNYFYYYRP